jgi:chloramphenicol 3-O-phosphotransferase
MRLPGSIERSVRDSHAECVHYCQSCPEPVAMEPFETFARCPQCGSLDDVGPQLPLFVVTGASGSGKTAIAVPLARLLTDSCVTFDVDLLLDSAGAIAEGRPIQWSAFRDAWVAVTHGAAQSGRPTVLLGPLIPEHLQDLPARRWIGDIHFVLLDCPDEVRRTRLTNRPPWRGRDMAEQCAFGQWLRRNIADSVDTSAGTPEQTARTVADWIAAHLEG